MPDEGRYGLVSNQENKNDYGSISLILSSSYSSPSSSEHEPQPLLPAREILNRLKWDPSFNINEFVIGYLDRYTGEEDRLQMKSGSYGIGLGILGRLGEAG